ncbi:PREDICTED: galanin receptor type 2 [Gavialis gangeticus]|uniref:galanin receptor type 2 n=1 Tax=Gavialis gangeticus TaxID=94835 RepID=UPI00092E7920|nr:PREDICTED: galanin receptor type 2 [Gavialis gangeticus]
MNGSLNTSGGGEAGWQPEAVLLPLVYSLIFLVGTVGNALVLAVLLRNGQVHNTTNLFILNLGVADLCFIVFCVPFQATIYTLEGWVFGPFLCKAVHFFIYLTMYASSFTLATVSLDRYLAIRYPLHSRELRTPRNGLTAICLIWGLSFIFSGPYLSYYEEFQTANLTVCHPIWKISQRKIMDLCTFIFSYVIPVLILSLTYVRTIRYLWTSVDPIENMSESKKAKCKVTRMIIIVAVLFCLCWLPHHLVILCVWFGYFPLNHNTYVLRILSHLISYANSCVNPIVYALVSKHFRKGFKKIFICLLHKKVANKVHVAQATNTVSTLEADLTEVTHISEPPHARSSTCCQFPAQSWGEAELVGRPQKTATSFITFNVT